MNIYILRCGSIRVSETVPYGNAIDLKNTAKQLTTPDRDRITLPVCAYLVEHPRGLLLVDTGWCREISPRGVYDQKAVRDVLPSHLAALFHPVLPEGMAVHEQLAAMGIRPEDLDCVILTKDDIRQRRCVVCRKRSNQLLLKVCPGSFNNIDVYIRMRLFIDFCCLIHRENVECRVPAPNCQINFFV